MRSIIRALAPTHQQCLAVGRVDPAMGGADHFPAEADHFPAAADHFPAAADRFPGRADHFPAAADPVPLVHIPALAARDDVDATPALDQALAQLRPDVVHVHNVMNPAALRWAAAHEALVTVQDHRAFCPGRGKLTADEAPCEEPMGPLTCQRCFDDRSYFDQIYELTRARLDALQRCRLTVLSRYMERELIAVGCDEAAIEVIPPFVDDFHAATTHAATTHTATTHTATTHTATTHTATTHAATTQDRSPCVLFAGRLARAKGVDAAIDAWQRSGIDLPLVFAGTGPERAQLERQGHRVLGWLARDQLAAQYRRARVVLFPSRWQEPFGIVGLESLTLGTPVAAWRSGGVQEWHPGGAGLVDWGDVEALGRAAASLAGKPAEPPAGFERQRLMQALVDLYGHS
jgi:glycosyltransferase involved in cell wall biosynthesis